MAAAVGLSFEKNPVPRLRRTKMSKMLKITRWEECIQRDFGILSRCPEAKSKTSKERTKLSNILSLAPDVESIDSFLTDPLAVGFVFYDLFVVLLTTFFLGFFGKEGACSHAKGRVELCAWNETTTTTATTPTTAAMTTRAATMTTTATTKRRRQQGPPGASQRKLNKLSRRKRTEE